MTLLLADDLDLSRGDLISGVADAPDAGHRVLRHHHPSRRSVRSAAGSTARCCGTARRPPGWSSTSIDNLLDIDSLTFADAPKALALNDIAQVTLRTADPLPVEDYRPGGAVGSLLIIDPADGTTLSAGMVGDRRAALHPEPSHLPAPPPPRRTSA